MVRKILNHRIAVFAFVLGLIAIIGVFGFSRYNEVEALSKYGSRGSEVRQIQEKLKRWGYYSGSIDGIYGSETLAAVKYFQRKNGFYFLPPDNPNVYLTYVHPFLRINFRIFS